MQLLSFSIGSEDYAIESRRVVEVLPLVPARPIPRLPDFVRGVFVYRGRLVPLIDLGRLLTDAPLRERLSTRIMVVELPRGPEDRHVRLGVAAENVVSLCSDLEADAAIRPPTSPAAPFLGRLIRVGGRTLQVLDAEHILPPELLAALVVSTTGSTDDRSEA